MNTEQRQSLYKLDLMLTVMNIVGEFGINHTRIGAQNQLSSTVRQHQVSSGQSNCKEAKKKPVI